MNGLLGMCFVVAATLGQTGTEAEALLDMKRPVIVVQSQDAVPFKTVEMLALELHRRTGILFPVLDHLPRNRAAFLLNTSQHVAETLAAPPHPEAYALHLEPGRHPRVHLTGHDARGVLFAVGRLLRVLHLDYDYVAVPADLSLQSAPKYAFRGHQMGYRNTANSYDLWDLAFYEQYIRDFAIFGTNGIEIISDFTNEFGEHPERYQESRYVRDSPLMALSQWDMNLQLAGLIHDYGLDVWIWEPLAGDVTRPEIAEAELEWRRQFYAEVPHVDHVFVPGGDPGRTHPMVLMPWLEQHAAVLRERFPEAGLWVSNQKFTPEENANFLDYIKQHEPDWLKGVVYGPGTLISVQELREQLPARLPIRHYPDITHNLRCQFPVPGWDRIQAQTLDREAINPRPFQMAHIHNFTAPQTNGFVSYSDGIHDDLNKAIFSAMAWDPEAEVAGLVREYAKVFFGEHHAQSAARGLLALEEAFETPIDESLAVDATLELWQELGGYCSPLHTNWRYQMYRFRAMFDAYIRARLLEEMQYEADAYDALREAPTRGVAPAIAQARALLAQADMHRVRPELRLALEELGLVLLRSCGFQLSIDEPYRARNPERGALLDKLDRPLNDRPWLEVQFARILAEKDASRQLAALVEVVNWENPGPGGFYDDLGNTRKQPRLVRQTLWEQDPGFDHGPLEAYYRQMSNETREIAPLRLSWTDQIETPSRTPIVLRYEGLDPEATYRVRATYFGRYGAVMKLVADGTHVLSEEQGIPDPIWPVEFPIPHAATADGELELAWHLVRNRGCQLAEVWLLREP